MKMTPIEKIEEIKRVIDLKKIAVANCEVQDERLKNNLFHQSQGGNIKFIAATKNDIAKLEVKLAKLCKSPR